MHKTKLNSHGFHVLPVLLVIVVLGVVWLVGWRVVSSNKKDTVQSVNDGSGSNSQESQSSTSAVTWNWGGDSWRAQGGTAPDCDNGPQFKSPVEVSAVKSMLYPGQQRSTGYKTHGGFLMGSHTADVTVPIDSHLIKASRYIEMGEVQYFFVFSVPCGFAYRFDHLHTLTPKFQAIVDKLPEAKVDDSRTTPIEPAISVTAGEKIATKIGFQKATSGFDFGIYDVRQQNEVSKTDAYVQKHEQEKEFAYYGVCFFDYFDEQTEATFRSLPATDPTSGKSSDYCK